MAQKLNPFSARQFLDADGDPYVGAKLFTYVAGSTTKVTVTKDLDGLSNHTNPIILNARGEPADVAGSAQAIWQPEGIAIDMVLAPATDSDPPVAAIATWPDVSGINDAAVTTPQDQWNTGPTPTYISGTSFSLIGDQTSTFHIGRRVRTVNSGGAVYGTITNSAYTSLTTITVANDSGAIDSGLSAVSYGIVSSVNTSLPAGTRYGAVTFNDPVTFDTQVSFEKGADIASATALVLGTDGNYFDVTGTTAITSITTVDIGTIIKLHFDAALTLTHHATDLILPDATNITTAAGDEAEFIEYATGDWKLTNYLYATTPKIQTADLEQTASSEAVTQATIRDAAVGQAQLKTTTASQTVNITAGISGNIIPTGSTYTISKFDGAITVAAGRELRQCANGLTYSDTFSIFNTGAGANDWYLYTRYVQASPPWNMGNGDIALFITLKMNKITGQILAMDVAPDPHCAYHGPHNLHPHDGKIQKAAGAWGKNLKAVLAGTDTSMSRAEALSLLRGIKEIKNDPKQLEAALKQEFTMEEKMLDMAAYPYSFSPPGPDEVCVIVDPCGSITDDLAIIHEHLGEDSFSDGSVNSLFESGAIVLGDQISANAPPGMIAVSAKWKNTV